jgi:ribosomal-protein-alanine N-acetyltransferase
MILQTQRLTLRLLEMGDAQAMHALMSDAEIMAFWDVPEIDDIGLTRAIMEAQIRDIDLGRALYWAMIRREDDAFVGCCDLSEIDRWHRRAEVGFMVDKPFWRGGYAFEAMEAVIGHAARGLNLKRLSARTHLGNTRSVQLLMRLGFEREGLLRGYIDRAGERRDCLVFGLLL